MRWNPSSENTRNDVHPSLPARLYGHFTPTSQISLMLELQYKSGQLTINGFAVTPSDIDRLYKMLSAIKGTQDGEDDSTSLPYRESDRIQNSPLKNSFKR
jgi:hypothetical protein